jgi:hypothetical protein
MQASKLIRIGETPRSRHNAFAGQRQPMIQKIGVTAKVHLEIFG